jgi:pimeloyl-ACP methyl ester carboxylesterase
LILAVISLLIAAAGLLYWNHSALGPMDEALAALESDDDVTVDAERWLVFDRPAGRHDTGFIIYPGGRVDPRSYAPVARAIAERGYLTVIVPMPLNLAVLGSDRATDVMRAFPAVKRWAVGGHSLGGAMAAAYASRHQDAVAGVVLWAAYPPDGERLTDSSMQVSSIYGTLDGVATPEEILGSAPLLPADTNWVPIVGGNHAQFGHYGPQDGDNEATISREVQQTHVVEATIALLQSLGP